MVYRAKFAPTVFSARQFVNHGHVKVNGRRVTIPSYRVKVGDVIEARRKAKSMAIVLEALHIAERDTPDYIEVDPKMTASSPASRSSTTCRIRCRWSRTWSSNITPADRPAVPPSQAGFAKMPMYPDMDLHRVNDVGLGDYPNVPGRTRSKSPATKRACEPFGTQGGRAHHLRRGVDFMTHSLFSPGARRW